MQACSIKDTFSYNLRNHANDSAALMSNTRYASTYPEREGNGNSGAICTYILSTFIVH